MVQVIQSVPSGATYRQAALDDAIRTAISGFAQLEANKKAEEATKRQQALDEQKKLRDQEEFELEKEVKRSTIAKNKQEMAMAPFKRKQEEAAYAKTLAEAEKLRSEAGGVSDPSKRLSKLSAEAQGKVAGVASALEALSGMESALAGGDGPQAISSSTPFIGGIISDTPYTQNERLVAEVVGRLQSGGAISAPELETFKSLGPRFGDSDEIRVKKLAQQRSFLENKARAFGIKPEEFQAIGLSSGQALPKQQMALQPVNSGAGFNPTQRPQAIPTAQASTVQPRHQEAVKTMTDDQLKQYLGIK